MRRALRVGLPVLYLLALVSMGVAGWFALLDGAAGAVPGNTAVAESLTLVVGLTVPVVAVLGGYLGAFPAVRALRDVEVSAATVTLRLARYLVGVVALVTLLVAADTSTSRRALTAGNAPR